jgi:hypothetical protein
MASRPGPTFPSVASNDSQPLHSVLTDPAKSSSATANSQPAPPADNWISNWGKESQNSSNSGATISRNGSGNAGAISQQGSIGRDSGLTQVQPTGSTPAAPVNATTNDRFGDSWSGTDSWSQPSQPTLGSANAPAGNNRPATVTAANNNQTSPFGPSAQPSNQFAGQPGPQPPAPQQPAPPAFGQSGLSGATLSSASQQTAGGNQLPTNPIGTGTDRAGGKQSTASSNETQPWMPLIAAVLVLAGSLAANLYLGASYLDARQKYQSLVRKTADTFRRVKAAAA